MRRASLIAALVVLGWPGVAVAHPRHHRHRHAHRAVHRHTEWHGTRQEALAIAEWKARELWGAEPCGSSYSVQFERLPAPLGGEATWVGSYATPYLTWTDCVIHLSASMWRSSHAIYERWPEVCTVVLHEWGHLTGHPHSGNLRGEPIPGEPSEPPGTTGEQSAVMSEPMAIDARCGWEP